PTCTNWPRAAADWTIVLDIVSRRTGVRVRDVTSGGPKREIASRAILHGTPVQEACSTRHKLFQMAFNELSRPDKSNPPPPPDEPGRPPMKPLPVRKQLPLACGGMPALVLLVSALGVRGMAGANDRFDDFVNGPNARQDLAGNVRSYANRRAIAVRD